MGSWLNKLGKKERNDTENDLKQPRRGEQTKRSQQEGRGTEGEK